MNGDLIVKIDVLKSVYIKDDLTFRDQVWNMIPARFLKGDLGTYR